jgi:hypothetical protein
LEARIEGAVAAPPQVKRLFVFPVLRGSTAQFMAGCAGSGQPLAGSFDRSSNPHGLPPSIGSGCGRFQTCFEGAIMADTQLQARASAVALNPIISPINAADTVTNVASIIEDLGAMVSGADCLEDVRSVFMMFSAASSALMFEVEAGNV